jgi:hypothetical protein
VNTAGTPLSPDTEPAATPHLWEADHPYYCNEGNYYANESVCDEHKNWASFADCYIGSDMDMNLVFRWDWREGEGWGAAEFNNDVNYRNGHLLIFWMGQRKGLYRYSKIEVCRADENAVIEFLRPRWEHLKTLWEPLSHPLTRSPE